MNAHTARSLFMFALDIAVHLKDPRKSTPALPKARNATMGHILKPYTDCVWTEWRFHH